MGDGADPKSRGWGMSHIWSNDWPGICTLTAKIALAESWFGHLRERHDKTFMHCIALDRLIGTCALSARRQRRPLLL